MYETRGNNLCIFRRLPFLKPDVGVAAEIKDLHKKKFSACE
jgi:hypothetical protein